MISIEYYIELGKLQKKLYGSAIKAYPPPPKAECQLIFAASVTIGWLFSQCSFSMLVKWANNGKMLVNNGEMLINDVEMSIWSYTHFTIID